MHIRRVDLHISSSDSSDSDELIFPVSSPDIRLIEDPVGALSSIDSLECMLDSGALMSSSPSLLLKSGEGEESPSTSTSLRGTQLAREHSYSLGKRVVSSLSSSPEELLSLKGKTGKEKKRRYSLPKFQKIDLSSSKSSYLVPMKECSPEDSSFPIASSKEEVSGWRRMVRQFYRRERNRLLQKKELEKALIFEEARKIKKYLAGARISLSHTINNRCQLIPDPILDHMIQEAYVIKNRSSYSLYRLKKKINSRLLNGSFSGDRFFSDLLKNIESKEKELCALHLNIYKMTLSIAFLIHLEDEAREMEENILSLLSSSTQLFRLVVPTRVLYPQELQSVSDMEDLETTNIQVAISAIYTPTMLELIRLCRNDGRISSLEPLEHYFLINYFSSDAPNFGENPTSSQLLPMIEEGPSISLNISLREEKGENLD